jgi:hypothetical protein
MLKKAPPKQNCFKHGKLIIQAFYPGGGRRIHGD